MKTIKAIIKSFGYAFSGIASAIRSERNLRIHTVAAILVTGFGILYRLTSLEWAVIALTIASVIAAELFNTAIEAAVDRSGTQKDEKGKTAKDCSAAAVLIFAMASVVVAICVFSDTTRLIPAIISLFTTWRITLLIIYIILSLIFITGKPDNK